MNFDTFLECRLVRSIETSKATERKSKVNCVIQPVDSFKLSFKLKTFNYFVFNRISTGGGYGYITNKSPTANWELGNFDINQNESFTGQTFAEVYKNPEKYSYIQYNDAKPEGVGSDSSTYAHAKGKLGI